MVACEGSYGEFQNSGLQRGQYPVQSPAGSVVTSHHPKLILARRDREAFAGA